jgi:hypothetical protein
MFSAVSEFAQRHWLGLALAIPVVVFAAWIASVVVPEIVKTVVPEGVRTVMGS